MEKEVEKLNKLIEELKVAPTKTVIIKDMPIQMA
jgi:hypothetical protein